MPTGRRLLPRAVRTTAAPGMLLPAGRPSAGTGAVDARERAEPAADLATLPLPPAPALVDAAAAAAGEELAKGAMMCALKSTRDAGGGEVWKR